MNLRVLALIWLILPCNVFADSWSSDLIKFNLENGTKLETMLWISGYSYASTAFYQRANCIKKSEIIGSKLLIESLNYAYSGKTITSEEASNHLDAFLSEYFGCKPYNNPLKRDLGDASHPKAP